MLILLMHWSHGDTAKSTVGTLTISLREQKELMDAGWYREDVVWFLNQLKLHYVISVQLAAPNEMTKIWSQISLKYSNKEMVSNVLNDLKWHCVTIQFYRCFIQYLWLEF